MYDMEKWCGRLIEHEGLHLMPYRGAAGGLFIGAGRNLDENPPTQEEKRALGDYMHGIVPNAAKMLLRNDIRRYFEALKKMVLGFEELGEERQYALVDMCFQSGIKGFKKLRRLRRNLARRNFVMAAFECIVCKYARRAPKRTRRIAYALKTGEWK